VLGWAPSHGLPEMVADTLAAASGPGG